MPATVLGGGGGQLMGRGEGGGGENVPAELKGGGGKPSQRKTALRHPTLFPVHA
jgi:hypothetical protein